MAYTKTVWKDYPDTTTKMTAQKLNNIENGIVALDGDMNDIKGAVNQIGSYNIATPGSNGDFYCTLKGSLSTNDIVTISFPTATNGASVARLSIDNGINYYNVYYNTINVKAGELSNNYVTLYFDGVKFVSLTKVITGNVSISTYSTSDQTTSGTNLLTLSNTPSILRTGGKKLLIIAYSQAYNSGDSYAYNMNVIIGNNAIEMCINNGTTKNTIIGTKILDNIPAGEYSTYLLIKGTNASSSLIVPSYSPYGYSIIEI